MKKSKYYRIVGKFGFMALPLGIAFFLFAYPTPALSAEGGGGESAGKEWSVAEDWDGDIYPAAGEEELLFHHTTYQSAYIWQNDDGADVNSNTADLVVNEAATSVKIGQRLTARIQLRLTTTANATFTLQYENNSDDPGTWNDVGENSPIAYSLGLAGSDGAVLTGQVCGSQSETWQDGAWYEGRAYTDVTFIDIDYYTEFAFMIHTANAQPDKTYKLRLYDKYDGAAVWVWDYYPTLSTVTAANNTIRYSKDGVNELSTGIGDLKFYLDDKGYGAVAVSDNTRDEN